jgi:glucosamine--fructose-6-phosphate aminotransferase (isomerizing)
MCGIVGYVGREIAAPTILEGLRRLEYRGYDSTGLAILSPDHTEIPMIQVRRSAGRLSALERLVEQSPPLGRCGIGHTRWATHGPPSDANAHPHLDCTGRFAVVHNGILENFDELRSKLLDEGHTLKSDTDTELIAHLFERAHEQLSNEAAASQSLHEILSLDQLARHVVQGLRGSQAIVILSSLYPDRLLAARTGHAGAVAIGFGDREMLVASDVPAVVDRTRRFVFLQDRELALLTADGASIWNFAGVPVNDLQTTRLQITEGVHASPSKGDYPFFMLKEIHQQAETLGDAIRGRVTVKPASIRIDDLIVHRSADHDRFTMRGLRQFSKVILLACGTPWNACLVGREMIERWAKLPATAEYAHEFAHRSNLLVDDRTLAVVVTQSGETVDVLLSLEEAKRRGATVLAITNVEGSSASREAHAVWYMRCGPEFCVAETKAFTSQLCLLTMLACFLGMARNTMSSLDLQEVVRSLIALPDVVGGCLSEPQATFEDLCQKYGRNDSFLFLGRGLHYPIAFEGALKLKELSYLHAEGYPAGEMKHGPIALVHKGYPVVAIAVQGPLRQKMMSQIEQVRARGARVLAIGTQGDVDIAAKADDVLWVPPTADAVSPIVTVVPLQLFAYYMAISLGCDVDHPRNLAKSVTVE